VILTLFTVAPLHVAFALLNEEAAASIPGGVSGGAASLFASAIQRAGGEPNVVKRGLQKAVVRLPVQSPAPDEISLAYATTKVLREAEDLRQTMHDSFIAQDHILLALIKDPTISAALKEASLTEAALKTAITQIRGNRRVESKTAEQGFDARCKSMRWISLPWPRRARSTRSSAEITRYVVVFVSSQDARRTTLFSSESPEVSWCVLTIES
jgi:ATP-dependent Clp protease ATP-binding subunit ClpA